MGLRSRGGPHDRHGAAAVGYISVEDVAAFAVSSLTHPIAKNRDLPLRGPEPLSALEAVAIAERVAGLTFRVRRAPLPLLKLVRLAAGRFHSHFDALLGLMIGQEASSPDLRPAPYEAFGVGRRTFEAVRWTMDRRLIHVGKEDLPTAATLPVFAAGPCAAFSQPNSWLFAWS